MSESKLNVFIAYSRKDENLRNRLDVHLSSLKRKEVINTWFDGKILPGEQWEDKIVESLNNADIILLLISPDFIASDYCYNIEMKRAVERHENGTTIVIPIILNYCDWEETPFSKLQALPKNGTPIIDNKWHNEDEAFHSAASGIKAIASKLIEERKSIKLNYYSELNSLNTEIENLNKRINYLKLEESNLENSTHKELNLKVVEYEKTINNQKNTILELKEQLNKFTNFTINDEVLNPIRKVVIINSGHTYSTINNFSDYKWKNEKMRLEAGKVEWEKKGFYPKNGMRGTIVDEFYHNENKEKILVLLVDNEFYVPIGSNGVQMLE